MKKISRLLIILLIVTGVYACRKIESLPAVPYIEYRSVEVFDYIEPLLGNASRAGILKFYFEDGDGDVGTEGMESSPDDENDLIISLYRKSEGMMVPAYYNDSAYTISWKIHYMEREGQNKILKGTIEVFIDLLNYFSITDTARLDFYIRDRAMNRSNVVSTNEIIISEDGIY